MRVKLYNENNPNWKGDKVGYGGIHAWVKRHLGKASKCEQCKILGIKRTRYHWANISGKYKRNFKDWKQLCVVCHRGFDKIAKLTKDQATEIKYRLDKGEIQKKIAKEFNVDQGTISNIKRNIHKFYAKS